MTGLQLTLTDAQAGGELELVDAELVTSPEPAGPAAALAPSPTPPPAVPALQARNLFGEAQRIAARAASASTRRQYAAIFRAFGDWLAGELGRPPVVGDLDADVIAAYGRHLATTGGRGGRPAAPATVRVYLSMVRTRRMLGIEQRRAAGERDHHEQLHPCVGQWYPVVRELKLNRVPPPKTSA